jgi:hypothetical protein
LVHILNAGSIETWPSLEHKFHEYFYNGEVELRLSNLMVVRQTYNEPVPEYLKRFRGIKNRCYNMTIGEKDLVDLAFTGLASYLKEKMEVQEFLDMNQVLQKAMLHENCAKEHRSSGRFKESSSQDRDRQQVNCVSDESASEEEAEVCVAEWVDTPRDKPISCSFLRPSVGKKEEIKYTFDVTKCDKLFDVLVKGV